MTQILSAGLCVLTAAGIAAILLTLWLTRRNP